MTYRVIYDSINLKTVSLSLSPTKHLKDNVNNDGYNQDMNASSPRWNHLNTRMQVNELMIFVRFHN